MSSPRPLDDDLHDPAGAGPRPGPVGRLADPGAGLAGGRPVVQRIPDHGVHGRQRQALQHGVVAHPGHVVRAPLLQRRHQRLAGISRVEHGGLPAQMPLRPLQHLDHELQPAVRRVHLPFAQPQVQDVARLPRRRHDRMIHAPTIVAVPRAARLLPVNLDRQAVDVDHQRLRAPPAAHRLQPPTRPAAAVPRAAPRRPPSPTTPPPGATASAATAGTRPRPAEPCPPGRSWPAAAPDRPAAPSRRCGPGGPAPPAVEASAPAAAGNAGSGARPRLSGSPFARNRATLLRRSSSRPVRAPESPVIRSSRDPILIDLLKLNGASIIFTLDVMAGECSILLTH